jgi:hypothetical protein
MLALVLTFLAAANAQTIDVKGANSLRADVSSDQTRLTIEATGDVENMTQALLAAGATVERISSKRVWASVGTAEAYANVRTQGARIFLAIEPRAKPMLDRLRERLPDFASLADSKAFRQADNAIAHGDFKEAASALASVPSDAPAYPWAQLRGADVAMLSGDSAAACGTYSALARLSLERTSNVLAAVRARTFGCNGALEIDWAQTLKRARNVDGGTGLWMAYELIAAADVVREAGDVDALLAAAKSPALWPQTTRSLVSRLAARLLTRGATARAKESLALAEFIRKHTSELAKHADGQALRLDAARALLDLDLADDSVSLCAPLLVKNLPRAEAPMRTWRILADAYASRGDSDSAGKLAKAFEERFHETLEATAKTDKPRDSELMSQLSSLERRINRLKAHVGARAPGESQ